MKKEIHKSKGEEEKKERRGGKIIKGYLVR